VGDAVSGSRTTRAGTRQTPVRRRAVGTRERIIAHLSAVTEVADPTGMASTKLAEAVGYPGSSIAFAQLLSGMERDGLIEREVHGKRTYRIALSPGAAGTRPPAPRRPDARSGPDAARSGPDAARGGPDADPAPPAADSGASYAQPGFDYDELARRLLVQVVRRLTAPPDDLEQTVAGLQRELATAWARHGTLTAENMRLREELIQARRELDLARERGSGRAAAGDLNHAEIVLLERLLDRDSEGQQSGATA
jgi:hypothetical protein